LLIIISKYNYIIFFALINYKKISNDIHAERIHIAGVEVGSTVTRLMDSINNLNDKVKQLETKLNNFEEVEEVEEDK
jgi:hypothetical protein